MVEFQPSKLAMRVRFPLPAPFHFKNKYYARNCRCSSMVEFQPSKLAMRVRFPLPAPFHFKNKYYARNCRCSSMVEFQPSKLAMRVRFPLPAPLISNSWLRLLLFSLFKVIIYLLAGIF